MVDDSTDGPSDVTTDGPSDVTTDGPSDVTGGGPAWQSGLPNTRIDVEATLEHIVSENRFTIAVLFPAVGLVSLVASAEGLLPQPLAFNPWFLLVGIFVMRAPLIVGVLPLVDRRAVSWIGVLVAYTYGIEYVGVTTGWPYGLFEYGVSLGPMVRGVPLALPLFFVPLVANAYLLYLLLIGSRGAGAFVRLATVITTVVTMDVVLDPGAVDLGFWWYEAGGAFHGVPLSNYAGWVVSATIATVALDRAFDRAALVRRLEGCAFMLDDMVSFVLLWGGVNLWFGNLVPALVAIVFGIALVRAERFDAALLLDWR